MPVKRVSNEIGTRSNVVLIGSFTEQFTRMTTDLRSRFAVLVGLAILGVGLAVIGTAVGATGFLTDDRGDAGFTVSEENVTFSDGDQEVTVVDNMTRVDRLEVEKVETGTYHVITETENPVTDSERRRAKAIIKRNETVRQALDDLDGYELTVEPVHKLTADSMVTENFTTANDSTSSDFVSNNETEDEEATYTFSVESEEGNVTVNRDPTYVENEVVVWIRHPVADDVYYTVDVDLENSTVVEITEWDDD